MALISALRSSNSRSSIPKRRISFVSGLITGKSDVMRISQEDEAHRDSHNYISPQSTTSRAQQFSQQTQTTITTQCDDSSSSCTNVANVNSSRASGSIIRPHKKIKLSPSENEQSINMHRHSNNEFTRIIEVILNSEMSEKLKYAAFEDAFRSLLHINKYAPLDVQKIIVEFGRIAESFGSEAEDAVKCDYEHYVADVYTFDFLKLIGVVQKSSARNGFKSLVLAMSIKALANMNGGKHLNDKLTCHAYDYATGTMAGYFKDEVCPPPSQINQYNISSCYKYRCFN